MLQSIRTDHYSQQNLGADDSFVRFVSVPYAPEKVDVCCDKFWNTEDPSARPALIIGSGPGARALCFASFTKIPQRCGSVSVSSATSDTTVADLYGISTPLVFVVASDKVPISDLVWITALLESLQPRAIISLTSHSSSAVAGVAGVSTGISLGAGVSELRPPELIGGAAAAATLIGTVPAIALRSCTRFCEPVDAVAACVGTHDALRSCLVTMGLASDCVSPAVFIKQVSGLLQQDAAEGQKQSVQHMYA